VGLRLEVKGLTSEVGISNQRWGSRDPPPRFKPWMELPDNQRLFSGFWWHVASIHSTITTIITLQHNSTSPAV